MTHRLRFNLRLPPSLSSSKHPRIPNSQPPGPPLVHLGSPWKLEADWYCRALQGQSSLHQPIIRDMH